VRRHAGPDRHGLRHNQPFKTQTQADETSTDADAGSSAATSAASIAASGSAATPAASTTPAASITSAASTTPSAERPGHTAFTYSPGLADFHRLSPRVKTSVVSTKKTPITIPALPKPKRSWEAGFTGSIGISSIQGPLVKKSAGPSSSAANYFSPVSLTTNGASNFAANGRAAGKQYVSDVRPDLSFSAGIIARKPLSSRWALTLGLGLHYYSSQLRLGYQDHYVPVPASASLITTAAAALPANASYYPAGDQQQFINKYYFLELPVALQWRINRSHLMPVFWEGGLSLAYLMGADAVYYNTHSGVYFKDDGAINKTQVNLSTSLMVGLPIRGVHIQAGPQLQYGLSNVVVTKVTNDQRFMYTGIRVVLMPGK
jgi:hypothetical protein